MKTIRLYSILTQLLVAFVLLTDFSTSAYAKTTASSTPIKAVTRLNPTTAEILFENGQRMTVDFYGNYIFRLFLDPNGGFIREPEASPEAHILVQNPRRTVEDMAILEESDCFVVKTKGLELSFDKKSGLFKAKHAMANHGFEQTSPVQFGKDGDYTLTLKANPTEYSMAEACRTDDSRTRERSSTSSTRIVGPMAECLPLLLSTGQPTAMDSWHIRSRRENTISEQLIPIRSSSLTKAITWMCSS